MKNIQPGSFKDQTKTREIVSILISTPDSQNLICTKTITARMRMCVRPVREDLELSGPTLTRMSGTSLMSLKYVRATPGIVNLVVRVQETGVSHNVPLTVRLLE